MHLFFMSKYKALSFKFSFIYLSVFQQFYEGIQYVLYPQPILRVLILLCALESNTQSLFLIESTFKTQLL